MNEFYTADDWFAEREAKLGSDAERDEHKLSYQLARLRLIRGITQKELAKRVGTKQSSISRLERGNHKPRIGFLEKVVDALDGILILDIYPKEEYKHFVEIESLSDEETGARDVPIEVPNWPTPDCGVVEINDSAYLM